MSESMLDRLERSDFEDGQHDALCEAEFIHGPMAYSPCGCRDRRTALIAAARALGTLTDAVIEDWECLICGVNVLDEHHRDDCPVPAALPAWEKVNGHE